MRIAYSSGLVVLAFTALAPCAFADEAPPAAPAAPVAAPAAAQPPAPTTPPAPQPPPAADVAACCGSCAPSTCCPPRDPCRRGRVEIQAGVSLLSPSPEGRATQPSTAGNEVVWDEVDYELAVSGRLAWTFAAGDWDVMVAGTYWGSWDESASQSPGRLTSNLGTTLFPRVDLNSEATVWDVNVTATQPFYCTPCFTASWGGGLRYVRFDEESIFFFTGVPPTDFIGADIDNALLAAEVVVDGTWKLSHCWDFFARLSAFGGWMHTSGDISHQGLGFPVGVTTNERDSFGFGGEAEVALRWHVNSCWTISVGYDLLVLGEVARGFDGADSSGFGAGANLGPILSEDLVLVHRAYLGFAFDL